MMRVEVVFQNSRKELLYNALLFALVAMALASVVFGIAKQVDDLNFIPLFLVSLTALFLSWQLSRIELSGWKAAAIILSVGVFVVLICVGGLWKPLLDWIVSLAQLLWHWLSSSEQYPTKVTLYWITLTELDLRIETLIHDFNNWLLSILSGNPGPAYLSISIVWGLIVWGISGWAGWFQHRWKKPLLAILPAGILLAIGLGYTYGATISLYPLIFSTLSLVALTSFVQRQQSWKQRSIDYISDDVYENSMLIFGIIIGFLVIAALIPRISFEKLITRVQQFIQPRTEQIDPILESFGLEQDLTPLGQIGSVMTGGLPRQHLIGAGPELSDQFVMSVHLVNEQTLDEILGLKLPLYWRAITYDHYTGFGWDSSEIVLENLRAEEPTIPIELDTHYLVQQKNIFFGPNELVYAAGEIVSLDTDYQMAWRIHPNGIDRLEPPGDFFAASQKGLAYQVNSLIPIVSENRLRAVRENPPAWLAERYLEVPDHVSRRVIDLVRRLTWNAPTNYDKARAIEAYLRSYEYELNLPAPPQNRELTDYFLFELQKGYCDYYATSMVVMARVAGIPARMVIGYTRGEYDLDRQQFVVTEANAHSWPELYFPGIGWIPFEPTASQQEITFPKSSRLANLQDRNPAVQERNDDQVDFALELQPWLLGIVLLPLIFLLLWLLIDFIYFGWLSPVRKMTKIYQRLYRQAAQMGLNTQIGDTPYEFAENLMEHIQGFFENTPWEDQIGAIRADVQLLTDTYVRSCYSSHPVNAIEAKNIFKIWRRLRYRLLVVKLAILLTPLLSPAKIPSCE